MFLLLAQSTGMTFNNFNNNNWTPRPLDSHTDRAARCVARVSKLPHRIWTDVITEAPVLNLNYADCMRTGLASRQSRI